MRIVFATTLLCIVFATAYADVKKIDNKYIETKTVEIDHGTIKDIKQKIENIKKLNAIREQELATYEGQYGALIAHDNQTISDLESNFKSDIEADNALVAAQANVEKP